MSRPADALPESLSDAALHEPDQALHVEDLTVTYGATRAVGHRPRHPARGDVRHRRAQRRGQVDAAEGALGLVRPVAGHVRFSAARWRRCAGRSAMCRNATAWTGISPPPRSMW
jgi:hypothetical protein